MKTNTTASALPAIRVKKVARLTSVSALTGENQPFSNQTIGTVLTTGI